MFITKNIIIKVYNLDFNNNYNINNFNHFFIKYSTYSNDKIFLKKNIMKNKIVGLLK